MAAASILLVDDDEDTCASMSDVFLDLGYTVDVAYDSIRCHAVDGRGVWDIPCVPDFTNARWQAARSDGQLVRSILEGRGAVMPPFRGTLTLEEGWGMARYLRTFLPGSEAPRPDLNPPGPQKR